MEERILLPAAGETPRRKFWKPWKWIALAAFAAVLIFNKWLPGFVAAAAYIFGIIAIANILFLGFRYLRNRLFWRVRNRLIGSFIFVGVIPLLTLAGIVFLSGYMLLGQLAAQYLENALREDNHRVSEIGVELAGQVRGADAAGAFPREASSVFSRHSSRYPVLAARLLRRLPDGSHEVLARHDPRKLLRDVVPYPGDKWRGADASFEGILNDNERMLLASFGPVPGPGGLYLETAAPLDESVGERLRRERSLYVTFFPQREGDISIKSDGTLVTPQYGDAARPGAKAVEVEKNLKEKMNAADARLPKDTRGMISWILPVRGKAYESGKNGMAGFAVFNVPRTVVVGSYLGIGAEQSPILVKVLYALAGMFIFAELVSMVIGLTISRRVTRSVNDMYQGILALQKGDLEHKIPVRRNDQLGLLAHAFNQMTGSILRLMDEVVEKKRLEQELEIAREVQATLFPKQLPKPPGMAVFGGCKPARVVSGDYYDFIVEDETHLNIVVGDISGKGISAALLMASLQAAMRSQILSSKGDPGAIAEILAEVMTQLNRQIYLSSPPEKYATLFLSRYDAGAHRLWYCNAGHLPPVLLSVAGTQVLEPTGMVVGLFPNAAYEAKSVDLPPGSLLAIFTDGVTEAVNKAEEEFGDKRLLDALEQSRQQAPESIWNHVMDRVGEWQDDLPQHDDITLIIAKT